MRGDQRKKTTENRQAPRKGANTDVTVITIPPNQWMSRIHKGMPGILQDDEVDTWLNRGLSDQELLTFVLKLLPKIFWNAIPWTRVIEFRPH